MIWVWVIFSARPAARFVVTLFTALVFALVFGAPILGIHEQAWAPFWFGQQGLRLPSGGGISVPIGPLPAPVGPLPLVSDAERFALAIAAGFSHDEAITATAISIAENGGGDPAALSAPNRDGSRDLGLWQINSGWWPQFGGQQALIDPLNNARAAHVIYTRQGWCAWSTYDARCGPGHTGSYANYLPRAIQAAR